MQRLLLEWLNLRYKNKVAFWFYLLPMCIPVGVHGCKRGHACIHAHVRVIKRVLLHTSQWALVLTPFLKLVPSQTCFNLFLVYYKFIPD